MREVYLDYSATTPVKQEVLNAMLPYFSQNYGNPSSLYKIGIRSKNAIAAARKQLAESIGASEREVFFTSGGTESDNWALVGASKMLKEKGNHIITTKIEHHAILHTCQYMEKFEGSEVTYLNVDSNGRIDLAELEAAITDGTILISIMFVNNEIGTIQPIKEIAEIAKKHGVLFHTDAVQALGNVEIDVKELGVDMMSMSCHKIYGPKGIGAMYIRKGLSLAGLIHGGGQEMKRRSGTENLSGIVGFGKAAELAKENLVEHVSQVSALRDYFQQQLLEKIDDIQVNGDPVHRHPGNLNVLFHYIEGEALLFYMDLKGIYVSTGSACSAANFAPSHVLTAIGLPEEKALSTIRFTVGDMTTKEDIDYAVAQIVEIVSNLRAISPFKKGRDWERKD